MKKVLKDISFSISFLPFHSVGNMSSEEEETFRI